MKPAEYFAGDILPSQIAMKETILLVEDDQDLKTVLTDRLEEEGYNVRSCANGTTGYGEALKNNFDLILLDLMLPGKNGVDVCRDLRQAGLVTPILMLSTGGRLIDKVLGLKLGADDYIVKPFEMLELITRIEVLLRRSSKGVSHEGIHQFGSVTIDLPGTAVFRDGHHVPLSAREFELLRYLIEHQGYTISRATLLEEVWGYKASAYTRSVDAHIFTLRHKIEDNPRRPTLIVTVTGLGYKIELSPMVKAAIR
jgi:two-component system, OmpR family, alkaline phosphatase synthesis response regulator PhoP